MNIRKIGGEESQGVVWLHDPAVDKDGGDRDGDVSLPGQSLYCRRFRILYNPSFCTDRFQLSLRSLRE